MSVPEQYDRNPTQGAIESLSKRFGIPIPPFSQDWEYEVAEPSRLDEFLNTFCGLDLTSDERFTLAEMLMQCFDDVLRMGGSIDKDSRWHAFTAELNKAPLLHAYTFYYWSCLESTLEDAFHIAPYARNLLEMHRTELER